MADDFELAQEQHPPAAGRLREIHAPTKVIGGVRDVSDIQEIVKKMAAEIPHAEQQMVLDAEHLVPMEKPAEFNRIALEFLAKHRPKHKSSGLAP